MSGQLEQVSARNEYEARTITASAPDFTITYTAPYPSNLAVRSLDRESAVVKINGGNEIIVDFDHDLSAENFEVRTFTIRRGTVNGRFEIIADRRRT